VLPLTPSLCPECGREGARASPLRNVAAVETNQGRCDALCSQVICTIIILHSFISRNGMKMGKMRGGIVSQGARLPVAFVIALACVVASVGLYARAGDIFDEDWSPPKAVIHPHSLAVQPATHPASPQVSRRAIPRKSEQAHSRGLLKEAFATQLKDRSPASRKKLAQMLLDEAVKAADNPADEFVLLGGAIEASKEAASVRLCFVAADKMGSAYAIDELNVKTDAVLKVNLRGDSPAAA